MKVLWFSNHRFSVEPLKASGGWLVSMADLLTKSGNVDLYNMTNDTIKKVTQQDVGSIHQWVIPNSKRAKNGLPHRNIINEIEKIVNDIQPDVIHVWGTERYWGLLVAKYFSKYPSLLDIQGIMKPITKAFYGGLSFKDLWKCTGIKEILKPSKHLYFVHRQFSKKAKIEDNIIKCFSNISVQSIWSNAYVRSINSSCEIHKTHIILRKEFYEASYHHTDVVIKYKEPVLFTTTAGTMPYKGLHVLFNALALLKANYPGIQLRIAGGSKKEGLKKSGYEKWLEKKIKYLGLEDDVIWLGNLDASEIVKELQAANCVIIPSFVESYCMALAEALTVGVPCVVSYAGAMPELAIDGESALYFPVGDYTMCAYQIEQILTSNELANTLKKNSSLLMKQQKQSEEIVSTQLQLYTKLLMK